jgi:hypothetical protein
MPQELLGPMPQAVGVRVVGTLAEKIENFLASFFEPHLGQGVPCHLLLATKISLSCPHFSQWTS